MIPRKAVDSDPIPEGQEYIVLQYGCSGWTLRDTFISWERVQQVIKDHFATADCDAQLESRKHELMVVKRVRWVLETVVSEVVEEGE